MEQVEPVGHTDSFRCKKNIDGSEKSGLVHP